MTIKVIIRAETNYKTYFVDGVTQPKAPYNDKLMLHYNDGRITDLINKSDVIRITTD